VKLLFSFPGKTANWQLQHLLLSSDIQILVQREARYFIQGSAQTSASWL
jgi:hypothetical protein